MPYRVIDILTLKEYVDEVKRKLEKSKIVDSWVLADRDKKYIVFKILLNLEDSQQFLDSLQAKMNKEVIKKIIVTAPEAVLPIEKEAQSEKENNNENTNKNNGKKEARDELYNRVSEEVTLNLNFLLLAFLSTIVVVLGLVENQVAVVIGAMVIAPMLGPNIAMALSVVLADSALFMRSLKINLAAIVICLVFSFFIGYYYPETHSNELMLRTHVDYANIVLALASGAAAALSLITRLSTVLVGVMVAVALLPPLATAGIMLGAGKISLAERSFLLFAINMVCVNLSANIVFLFKGIHPHKWYEKQKAKGAIFWYLLFWIISLLVLIFFLYKLRAQTM